MCVELICCMINSNYSLKVIKEYVLWPRFLKIDCTIFHELLLPLFCFNIFEMWWDQILIFCLQKCDQLSSVLFLLPLHEAFSLTVKKEKCGEGHKSKFHKQ